ncbi:MAG: hypothetical protein KDK40_02485 [Chlamydiia bacterium]|nr:hypothetical protein [Chlamydiia bacterium]
MDKKLKKRADGLSLGVLLVGLGVLAFTGAWWPWVMLLVGITMGLRHYVRGRTFEGIVSALTFIGIFCLIYFGWFDQIVLPIVLVALGMWVIIRSANREE